MSRSRSTALAGGLLLASAAAAVSLLSAELLLRTLRPVSFMEPLPDPELLKGKDRVHRRSSIPGLRYELTPGLERRIHGVTVRINRLGMRDQTPLDDAAGAFRVAVLGDSYTFGYGVEQRDTYAQVLEDLLNERAGDGRRYDVLNFGVGGYSTRDESLVWRHRALAFEPDLVLVAYVLNDPETRPLQPLHRHFHEPAWWQRWHLLRLVAEARYLWDVRRLGDGDLHDYLHRHPARWRTVVDALRGIAETARARGIPAVLVVFPRNPVREDGGDDAWEAYRHGWIHEQVAATARGLGFEVVDLLPVYSQHPPSRLRKKGAGVHPNERGHRLAAETILAQLLRRGVLGSEPVSSRPPGAGEPSGAP